MTETNNPTCGDRIRLTFDIEDGIIKDAKFEGEGCSYFTGKRIDDDTSC